MCGRFANYLTVQEAARLFEADPDAVSWTPRYNVAPGTDILACRQDDGRHLCLLRWGLVPSWAREPATGYRMINARAETVADKPAFRAAFRRRRCLIPANGFYEWQAGPGGGPPRTPWYFRRRDGRPLAMAGLWERWTRGDTPLESCTIIVTAANRAVAPCHDRMPVLLPEDAFDPWLDPGSSREALHALLQPAPDDLLEAWPVSRAVNDPRNDDPGLLAPAAGPEPS